MQPKVRRVQRLTGGVDPFLILGALALLGIGILMVYSASIASAYVNYGSPLYVFKRQVVWAVIGCMALAVCTKVPYDRWRRVALPFAAATVIMLFLVLAPHIGHTSHGARRWFQLGAGVDIQPSEMAKLALIIYLSAWLARKDDQIADFKHTFFPFAIILGFVAALIVKEPDLGTTIVLVVIMVTIYFIAGADMVHLAGAGVAASFIAWILVHSSKYSVARLTSFQNPWKDPTGVGYHTVQVLLALGSGGLLGRGFGNSVQKDVLPAPHTDSILAVIGEEWGLIGSLVVLLLFLLIAYRGLRVAITAPDAFGRLMATGITCWITFQALMNFGVITSSVPFTGVPLPFISYGGTSLIITMAAMGILLNISKHTSGSIRAQNDSRDRGRNGGTRVPRAIDHPMVTTTRRGTAHIELATIRRAREHAVESPAHPFDSHST